MNMEIKVKTNHSYRNLVSGYELNHKWRKEFDWMDDETFGSADFVVYRGHIYAVSEFMRIDNHHYELKNNWDGYHSDSYFSGIVIKFSDDMERVKVGTFYC